jgi:serine phosphatase RsbU (regulator of sigma subunit)
MEHGARRFIGWVLAIHAGLLILAVGVVAVAARAVYRDARTQALASAQETQEQLARATASNIQNYYAAVSAGLEWLNKPVVDDSSAGQSTLPGLRNAAGPVVVPTTQGANIRENLVQVLWADVRQRAAMLAIVDTTHARPIIVRIHADEHAPDAHQVVDIAASWLNQVKTATLGPLMTVGGVRYNLMAEPVRGEGRRVLLAMIRLDQVRSELLADVTAHQGASALLLDGSGTVLCASDSDALGTNFLRQDTDPAMRDLVANYVRTSLAGSEVLHRGDDPKSPNVSRLATVRPVVFDQFGRQRWFLVIWSGLDAIDAVVNTAFRDAAAATACLVISVAAILASTAIQLIRGRIRLERMRSELLHRELEQARQIQLNWLPARPLRSARIDLAAINRPCSHISGDFYDWFELPDGRVTVTVGDVSGHGLTAAFLMATTQLLVRSTMLRVGDPGRCLTEVNRQLCTQAFIGQFVTMLVMTVDFVKGQMLVATAGHPPPLIGSGDKFMQLKMAPQLVLGVDPQGAYRAEAFPLRNGDSVVLYTDGVCDLVSNTGSRFDRRGLAAALPHDAETADSIIQAVAAAVETFGAGAELIDDLTLVAFRLHDARTDPPSLSIAG